MSQGATSAAAAEPLKVSPNQTLLTLSVIMASLMQSVDGTIANVILPHLQGSMNASLDQVAWVITSYVVAAAIGTPLTSFLATRFGRKRVFLAAAAGFTLASGLCGSAQNLEQIVLFRIIQGVSGALLIPLSQAIVLDAYPREKHPSVMSLWAMTTMTGPIFGPTIGGYLTEYYSWRWAFYINLPIGFLSIVGVTLLFQDTKRQPEHRLDFLGFTLLSLAIGSFQLMLDRGTTLDWFSSREIVVEACLAGITFYAFITHILTTAQPYVNTKMFRDANLSLGLFLYFLILVVIFSSSAILPTMMQSLLGYPVIDASLLMAPRALAMLVMTAVAGRLPPRLDPRVPITTGVMIIAFSMWLLSEFNLNAPKSALVVITVLQGGGMGLIVVPMMTAVFATLDPKYRTDGAVMFAMIRSLSISIGVSIVATMLARSSQANHADLVEYITPYSQSLRFLAPQAIWSAQSLQGAAAIDVEINRQASMMAYIGIYRLQAILMIVVMFPMLLLRPGKKAAPQPVSSPE